MGAEVVCDTKQASTDDRGCVAGDVWLCGGYHWHSTLEREGKQWSSPYNSTSTISYDRD